MWGAGNGCADLVYVKLSTTPGAGHALGNLLNPRRIILGDDLGDLFGDPVRRGLAGTGLPVAAVEVVPSTLARRATALGAAALALALGGDTAPLDR